MISSPVLKVTLGSSRSSIETSPLSVVSADEPISVETCRALTNDLQRCFRRATHLYRKVSVRREDGSFFSHVSVKV